MIKCANQISYLLTQGFCLKALSVLTVDSAQFEGFAASLLSVPVFWSGMLRVDFYTVKTLTCTCDGYFSQFHCILLINTDFNKD